MTKEAIIGLEIHQQLDTKKLFCSCDSTLVDHEGASITRRLRPTQSELGDIDRAALAEAEKRLKFNYQAPPGVSCLVEADEEPPHDANRDAIEIVLTIASLLNATPVDEIHFMRKIVIDGSNTTGFQRTALIAMDGSIEINGRTISIPTICLEEDAARKIEVKSGEVTYKLDRLGMPLVEIATGPELRTPEEVKIAAQKIGSLLRATKRVKRGIGTIREDLNISIPGGARVEIKGVQDLRMLPTYVAKEIERQEMLLEIRDMLLARATQDIAPCLVDCTDVFRETKSKIIRSSISSGGKALALPLKGFGGVLKSADGRLRLGAELAHHARARGAGGIFHSDELPAYGIDEAAVTAVRKELGLDKTDAFVICVDLPGRVERILEAVAMRARYALIGVPEETRDPLPDGTTAYSRPLPGAARMYPETDVKPIAVDTELVARIRERLPELPESKVKRFVSEYGIHEQQAEQIIREGFEEIFEEIASRWGLGNIVAKTLLNTFPELEREGIGVYSIDDSRIVEIFQALHDNRFAKEALPDILRLIAKGIPLEKAIEDLGLKTISMNEAMTIIEQIVEGRKELIKERKMNAMGPLMGEVMSQLRGKIDGKIASELLRKAIARVIGD
ncbi:MAG: Glu-tRNA(Gln) amidotransferase subunit GatE [Methanomassiliicoccales archaeon]|jgi:glutamyl-tRNA(Gln) amidotransferase subunit E|nr:Glu-tRNA(Gln) amidotransferase subunit GatE [Methanomassiliicoccales archaeon]